MYGSSPSTLRWKEEDREISTAWATQQDHSSKTQKKPNNWMRPGWGVATLCIYQVSWGTACVEVVQDSPQASHKTLRAWNLRPVSCDRRNHGEVGKGKKGKAWCCQVCKSHRHSSTVVQTFSTRELSILGGGPHACAHLTHE